MMRVGLTGGIASGKSTVARMFAEHGVMVLDYDQLARDVVAPGTPGLADVVDRFGGGVLTGSGKLDRRALGARVFADPVARRDLEAILHPGIRELAARREADSDADLVVHEIPLLAESGLDRGFDEVIVVDVDPAVQLGRVRDRDHLDIAAAQARIEAQASRADRLRIATIVLPNNATLEELRRASERVIVELIRESRRKSTISRLR